MALLWSLIFVDPLIILSTIVFGAVSQVVSLFDSAGRRQIGIAQAWARSLLWIVGVKVEVEGGEHVRPDACYVFTANHLSYMDTPVMLGRFPAPFRFLAKEGLFQIPFLGWHLQRAGHVPVPRENPRAAIRVLAHAADLIHSHQISLLIFSEGGRSRDGALQEFRDGAAYLAIKAQVPLVPVALDGTREILPMGSATFHRGCVRLSIGEPIPTAGMKSHQRTELSEVARLRIAEMLTPNSLRAGALPD
jgi:1-acyl-sn-glycerol-3-phosphate acyltransferase